MSLTNSLRFTSRFARLLVLLGGALALAGPVARAAGRLPSIYAFNVAAEATINLGTTTSLNWQVGDATSVTLEPGFGDVTNKTSIDIAPTATTTYVLTARNSAGSVSKSKKITVIVPPVLQSLTATPASITVGGSATLAWFAPGASYFTVTADVGNDLGNVFGNSVVVRPRATTTYTVTAVNTAGTDVRTIVVPVTSALPKPAIDSFTASPSTVTSDGSTMLGWAVTGATSLSISPGIGAVTGTSVNVTPSATTTYTLSAKNASGTVTKSVTVTVTPLSVPTIASFTATPSTIAIGSSTTLAWAASGATSFAIVADAGASPGPVSGNSIVVNPAVTTTYTLTATNASGSVTKAATVTVTPLAPTIASFTATPSTITKGDSTVLAWSIAGADTVTITPAIGTVVGNSLSIKPPSTIAYVLTATNAGGSVTKTVNVTVNTPLPLPVINSFTASPTAIVSGNPSTLAWSVTGADSLSITVDTGASPGGVTGTTLTLTPTANTTYTLTATNVTGSVTKSVSVAVTNPVPLPVIDSFAASPATIALGGSSTLSWSVTGATSTTISSDVGASPGVVVGNSAVVTPTAATNYLLTARNDSGSVTRSVKVTVNDPAPVIGSFASIPNTINSGETARIIWSVSGAATLSISANRGPSPGVVTGTTGSINVIPTVTTDYTLTATSPGGVESHSLTEVVVLAAPPLPVPVISSFTASPDTLVLGSSATLNWSVIGADTIAITSSQGASPGTVTGASLTVNPTVDTTYTLTATNTFGQATQTATVTVTGPSAPIIASFAASPAFIQVGQSAVLSWSVSGADAISLAADVGANPGLVAGSSLTVTPTASTTYTLTATNSIGQRTATVPVTIFTPGSGSVVHPRIWMTPAVAATLNLRAAANDPAWIKLRNDCDVYATMPVQFPDEDPRSSTINGGYQYYDYLLPSQELALGYAAAKTADPVRAARYAAKERELLLKLSDPMHHGRPTTDSGWSIRAYVPALALGYDWVFETLSDADRVQIYTEINRWVVSYETSGFGRDYPQGNYFAGYYCAKALGALATEGENPQGTAMWNDWLNRVHYGMVQPYHAAWLSGGGAPDGWNYGQFETINMLRPIAAAFTAKGLDLLHDARPFVHPDGHARWITQFTWPDLKTVSDRGFVYNSNNPTATDTAWATQFNGLLRLANGNNAPIMQRYTLDLRAQQGSGDVEPWAEFLLHSNSAPSASYQAALSYKTEGDGQVAMRSSWASDAVWAAFQAGPYTNYPGSSEEFFDEGALTIQRGGVQFLVNTWGAMMRNTPGTDDGDPVFNDVYNELFGDQIDGVHAGRRIFNTYYAVRAAGYWGQGESTPFDHSPTTLSRFEDAGSYVLMRGTQLEDQYFSDHPISAWTRTVVFVRPQVFVVYDRTSLKSAGADNWLAWHVGPTPRERTDAIAGTHSFDVIDTRAAFGGNLFRGRVSTVLPAGNQVKNVDVFGRGKVSRLEVRTASPLISSTWLTVFDAAASSSATKLAAPLAASVNGTVVAEGTLLSDGAGNTAVLFSRSGAPITGTLVVTLPAVSTAVVITDLPANTGYTVTASVANGQLALQLAPGGSATTSSQGSLALTVSANGAITTP